MQNLISKIIFSTQILFLALFPNLVFGAGLTLRAPISLFPINHPSVADVVLFTDGSDINAVEGTVVFPSHVALKSVWIGESVINLWIEPPRIEGDRVYFSGVTPGGINQELPVVLFKVVFEGIKESSGAVVFEDVRMLLDDGDGTRAPSSSEEFVLQVSADAERFALPEDTIPPEEFDIFVTQDRSLFEGRYFAVFSTQDKGLGVDYYEVQESSNNEANELAWKKAESPYLLEDQTLGSYLHVKAVDKAGNIRISVHEPEKLASLQTVIIYVIILVLVLCVFYLYGRNRKRKNSGVL